jgi:DNA-binding beta-propeller fold protein YncE
MGGVFMGKTMTAAGLALLAWSAIGLVGSVPEVSAQAMRVASDETATGFAFPESVAYDPQAKVLYVSQFGSELKPTEKDGKGKISKVSLAGKILEDRFLPASPDILNKPKGIWVAGNRLWVTDIDSVWVFDLKTRRGRKVDLPGIKFANDPALLGKVLYVSDNRGDQVYRVEPADFLDQSVTPRVSVVAPGKSINPNGLYPAKDGSLLMVGFMSADQPRGIYARTPAGEVKTLAKDLGRLDGLYQMADGSLLITNWNSGSLARWSVKGGLESLASGFKGPADFAVVPEPGGLLVVVPDLVKSELRLIRLAK